MKGELRTKSTRTVYSEKVVTLELDIPYSQVEEAETGSQDMLKWLDNNVGTEVSFQLGPFEDESQVKLEDEL